jgi:hypothetical protein
MVVVAFLGVEYAPLQAERELLFPGVDAVAAMLYLQRGERVSASSEHSRAAATAVTRVGSTRFKPGLGLARHGDYWSWPWSWLVNGSCNRDGWPMVVATEMAATACQ